MPGGHGKEMLMSLLPLAATAFLLPGTKTRFLMPALKMAKHLAKKYKEIKERSLLLWDESQNTLLNGSDLWKI